MNLASRGEGEPTGTTGLCRWVPLVSAKAQTPGAELPSEKAHAPPQGGASRHWTEGDDAVPVSSSPVAPHHRTESAEWCRRDVRHLASILSVLPWEDEALETERL